MWGGNQYSSHTMSNSEVKHVLTPSFRLILEAPIAGLPADTTCKEIPVYCRRLTGGASRTFSDSVWRETGSLVVEGPRSLGGDVGWLGGDVGWQSTVTPCQIAKLSTFKSRLLG